METYGLTTEEELRSHLPNSLRSVQRWKSDGYPKNIAAFLKALEDIGYFADSGVVSDSSSGSVRARKLVERIARDAENLAELL